MYSTNLFRTVGVPADRSIHPSKKKKKSTRHSWSRGMMSACHAGDPGSIPGECTLFNEFVFSFFA
jgi:hypothetical protein